MNDIATMIGAPTRRGFLLGAGALTFVIGAGGVTRIAKAAAGTAAVDLNMWLSIAPDGAIEIVFPSTEMGQGSTTALPLIVAEELDADWSDVRVRQLQVDDRRFGNPKFGNVLYTAGSSGVQGYFQPLRTAGAQARQVLIAAAAERWGVGADGLRTEPSAVVNPATGARLRYGEIVAGIDTPPAAPAPESLTFKPRSEYRLIGEGVPRIDVADKSRGTETYGIDVDVPNMAYATVLRAPVEGETIVALDDAETRAAPGVLDVVTLPDGVAVVADSYQNALNARDLLAVTWTQDAPARAFDSDAALEDYAQAAADMTRDGAVWTSVGDAPAAIAAAAKTVEAEYRSDYAYHAQIEPMAAVADVDDDGKGAEVWVGAQTQSWVTRTVMDVLDAPQDRVRLNMMSMGGSFGRRTALMQEYLRDALLASKAVKRPVKVVWTREDDVKAGVFRPAAVQKMQAGLTDGGDLAGFRHRIATPSVIAFFNPLRWSQVEPKDIISVRGSESKFYSFSDMLAEHVVTERQARLAPWRGIGASYTSFAAEAFIDELAEAAGRDPVEFRMTTLLADNPRGRRLLERVLEAADWGTKRSDSALGVAFAGYGDSMAAGVAEVRVDRDSGVIQVPRFWAAIDAGLIIDRAHSNAQTEGGVIFGVSSALKERVTIKGGVVEQENFYDYEILRANETPEIEVLIQETDAAPTGVGEVGTPMVAPAIANAFHALTGRRLRHIPFTPERVLEALA